MLSTSPFKPVSVHALLVQGARTVFEHAGSQVYPAGPGFAPVNLLVGGDGTPAGSLAIVCLEKTAQLEHWELEDLAQKTAALGFRKLHLIVSGGFSDQTLDLARQWSVQTTDSREFHQILNRLPHETRDGIHAQAEQATAEVEAAARVAAEAEAAARKARAELPPPTLDEIAWHLGKGVNRSCADAPGGSFFGTSLFGKACAALSALIILLIVASQVKNGVDKMRATLAEATAQAGAREAERRQKMHHASLSSNSAKKEAPEAEGLTEQQIVELTFMQLPAGNVGADSPVLSLRFAEHEKFLRNLWGYDLITDPAQRRLADALLEMEGLSLPALHALPDAEIIARSVLANADDNPRFAFAVALRTANPEEQASILPEFLPLWQSEGESILLYLGHTALAGATGYREYHRAAVSSLQGMLDETEGFYKMSDRTMVDLLFLGPADAHFASYHSSIADIVNGHRDVETWLKDLVMGMHYAAGPDETVTTQSSPGSTMVIHRKNRTKDLEAAHDSLRRSWQAHPEHPAAAAMLVNVSRELGRPLKETREWFDRAIEVQTDFSPAYDFYLHALAANSKHCNELLAHFGDSCFATGRYDTDIPRMLRRTHFLRSRLSGDPARYWATLGADERDQLHELFEQRERNPLHDSLRDLERSAAIGIWYACGDLEQMNTWHSKLERDLHPIAFTNMPFSSSDLLDALEQPE